MEPMTMLFTLPLGTYEEEKIKFAFCHHRQRSHGKAELAAQALNYLVFHLVWKLRSWQATGFIRGWHLVTRKYGAVVNEAKLSRWDIRWLYKLELLTLLGRFLGTQVANVDQCNALRLHRTVNWHVKGAALCCCPYFILHYWSINDTRSHIKTRRLPRGWNCLVRIISGLVDLDGSRGSYCTGSNGIVPFKHSKIHTFSSMPMMKHATWRKIGQSVWDAQCHRTYL